MLPPLREVGFWRAVVAGQSQQLDSRPDPRALVDAAWAGSHAARLVAAYVARCGFVESYELAHSTCRFAPAACAAPRRELGCATLTDGTWAWPEGLAHYLRAHAVRLPADFVEHALRSACALAGLPRADAGQPTSEQLAAALDRLPWRHHLAWDAAEQRAHALPGATAEFLLRVSTLRCRPDSGGSLGSVNATDTALSAARAQVQSLDGRPS